MKLPVAPLALLSTIGNFPAPAASHKLPVLAEANHTYSDDTIFAVLHYYSPCLYPCLRGRLAADDDLSGWGFYLFIVLPLLVGGGFTLTELLRQSQ